MLNNIAAFMAGGAGGGGGDFESIARATPSAGTTNITFSSIPSTYKHLQLRVLLRGNYGSAGSFGDYAFLTFNSDTASNYSDHCLLGNGSTVDALGAANTTSISRYSINYCFGTSISSSIFGATILDILDYSSTTKNKTVKSLSGVNFNTSSTDQVVTLASGLWRNTDAITSLNIFVDGGAGAGVATGTVFSLYGIKG
jgi:hypothetical protein